MKKLLRNSFLALVVLAVSPAWANALTLTTIAEVDVVTVNEKGEEVVTRVPAEKVVPGTEVIYTITAFNDGAEEATNVVVTNPIPEHTSYVADSANSSAMGKSTTIVYSVDKGVTYDAAAKLEVMGEDGVLRQATAEDYTDIRWTFDFAIPVKGKVDVSFRVRVK